MPELSGLRFSNTQNSRAGLEAQTEPGPSYSRMRDASEAGEGPLDALPQLPRPAETPGHTGHVLVHRGEPWGHGTGGMRDAPLRREPLPPATPRLASSASAC